MANRYWVGGTASWDATASSKWSATSGGAGGAAVPTAADDVFFDAASGVVTITTSGSVACRSLNCTGFTGTLNHAASTNINIGDAVAGAGNVALLFVSGMTYTRGASASLSFISTSATPQSITTGSKTGVPATFNNTGSWIAQDPWVAGATINHLSGTFNTNNQPISANALLSSGTGVRTLTLGASSITLTGTGAAWDTSTATNLTLNAGTSVITLSGATAIFSSSNTLTFYEVRLTGSGAAQMNGGTYTNVTRIGTTAKTDEFRLINTSITITGTLTITGNSPVNRVFVNNVVAAPRTFNAAAVSLSNVDFMDVNGAGAAAPFTGTSLGDALGNSGITFDAPVTQTRTGAGGNWSTAGNWTSRVPLPQDDVIVNSGASGTITMDMPRLGKSIDFTGFGGTAALAVSAASYGNLAFGSGMATSGILTLSLLGRGSHTITCNGVTINMRIQMVAPGGTYALADTYLASSSSDFINTAGSFVTNNFSMTTSQFQSTGSLTRSNTLGNSVITLVSNTATSIVNITGSNDTFSAASATFVIGVASAATRTFVGNGKTFGTLTYIVANSPGALVINGANTFNSLNIGPGRTLTMPSSTVNTIASGGTFNVNGANNGYLYLPGAAGNYASAPDSAALSITGDIDIMAYCALDDWTPTVKQTIISKYDPSQRAYAFSVTPTGALELITSLDGIANTTIGTSSVAGLTDGMGYWVRVTMDVDNGAGSKVWKFYTSNDVPSVAVNTITWSQLGATITQGGTTSIFDSSGILNIGSLNTGVLQSMAGKVYRTAIYNGYDGAGSLVFDADFTTKSFGANNFTESSVNAATVAINGALAQAGDGRVALNPSVPGTPAILSKSSGTTAVDYLTIQDSTATGGAAWYAGANSINVSGNSGWIFGALGATATKARNFLPFFGGSF